MAGFTLRAALEDWPRLPAPQSQREAVDRQTLTAYRERLAATTDFAKATVEQLIYEADRFLIWSRTNNTASEDIHLPEVDDYVKFRARTIRRSTCKTLTKRVARFLSFLYQIGRLRETLGTRIVSPTMYQHESIPSILEPADIATVLRETRRDRSVKGRRDYAILQLLATLGMRAGEITRLQLRNIDWHAETLTVTHTKTRRRTILPLMPQVAVALIAYLRHGRPRTCANCTIIVIIMKLCNVLTCIKMRRNSCSSRKTGNDVRMGPLGITNELLAALLERITEQALLNGFHHVILMGDHGGGQPEVYEEVANELNSRFGSLRVFYCDQVYRPANDAFDQYLAQHGYPAGLHGYIFDTSEMLYLDKDGTWVGKDLIAAAVGDPVVDGKMQVGPHSPYNGIRGDARRSTMELGKRAFDLKVDYAVRQIRSFVPTP